jgi:hypothetical protein
MLGHCQKTKKKILRKEHKLFAMVDLQKVFGRNFGANLEGREMQVNKIYRSKQEVSRKAFSFSVARAFIKMPVW